MVKRQPTTPSPLAPQQQNKLYENNNNNKPTRKSKQIKNINQYQLQQQQQIPNNTTNNTPIGVGRDTLPAPPLPLTESTPCSFFLPFKRTRNQY